MGKWMPEPMRSPSSAFVVVYGVPKSHVATCLVQGSEELVKPEDRERFRQLRVRRLLARAPEWQPATKGVSAAPASRITRSCRVFLPFDLALFFSTRGEMMLRWVRLPCKEYVPRKFFCKKCNRLGSHSTRHHRSIATIDDKNGPLQGATTQ